MSGVVEWQSSQPAAPAAMNFIASCKSRFVRGPRVYVQIFHRNVLYVFGLTKSDLMDVDRNQNWIGNLALIVVEGNDSASHRHHDAVNLR
jgi:hypothetical protein